MCLLNSQQNQCCLLVKILISLEEFVSVRFITVTHELPRTEKEKAILDNSTNLFKKKKRKTTY